MGRVDLCDPRVSMSNNRTIFKSATSAPNSARHVLAILLAQELVSPSDVVYLMAPWISNIVIFDNSVGQFDGLNAEWGRREIRLVEVLVAIAQNNTQLVIRVKPDTHNQSFCHRLADALKDAAVSQLCRLTQSASLHTKGLLTERALVAGSMNFTANGIGINDESLVVNFDPKTVSAARLEFSSYDDH